MTRTQALIVMLVAAAYCATGLAVVGPGERAVVRRFGRVVATPGPGLWFGRPWGVDRVDRVLVAAVHQVIVGADDPAGVILITGDENLIAVRLVIEYTIGPSDADLAESVTTAASRNERLIRQAEALAADWAATRSVDQALLGGATTLAAWVQEQLPALAVADGLGVAIQNVNVAALAAPPEVRDAFDAVTRAQALARAAEDAAEEAAGRRRAEAQARQAQLAAAAQAHRAEQQAAATAEASAFLARLNAQPTSPAEQAAHRRAIWWDELGRVLHALHQNGRVDLLDHRLGPTGLDLTQFATPPAQPR